MIQFLSSVISMVAPTWCHGAIGGNPFVGDWGLTWLPNLPHFNLVIRLSKTKQSALRLCTFLWNPASPAVPWDPLWNAFSTAWSCAEHSETPFFSLQLQLSQVTCAWLARNSDQAGTRLSGVVFFCFWWLSGEVKHVVHLIRRNLNSCFMPFGLTWLPSRQGNNARPLGT